MTAVVVELPFLTHVLTSKFIRASVGSLFQSYGDFPWQFLLSKNSVDVEKQKLDLFYPSEAL